MLEYAKGRVPGQAVKGGGSLNGREMEEPEGENSCASKASALDPSHSLSSSSPPSFSLQCREM